MKLIRWLRDDSAQDAFEYMVVAATVVIVVAAALFGFYQLVPQVVGDSCPAVDTAAAPAATEDSCITQSP